MSRQQKLAFLPRWPDAGARSRDFVAFCGPYRSISAFRSNFGRYVGRYSEGAAE
jgi:hypothetical protein